MVAHDVNSHTSEVGSAASCVPLSDGTGSRTLTDLIASYGPSMTTSSQSPALFLPGERSEVMHALAEQRALLLITARDITDAQAAKRTTVSELTLGGIVKHLTRGELV